MVHGCRCIAGRLDLPTRARIAACDRGRRGIGRVDRLVGAGSAGLDAATGWTAPGYAGGGGFDRIRDYTDIVGVSVYPYIFFSHANKGDPDNMPPDWLSQASVLAQGKPVAITETGWIGQDLIIPSFSVNVPSNPQFQLDYAQRLLDESNTMNVEFIIWWTIVDFDALWNGVLLQDPVASIWRDIGLVDEGLQPRPALSEWQDWLAKPRQ